MRGADQPIQLVIGHARDAALAIRPADLIAIGVVLDAFSPAVGVLGADQARIAVVAVAGDAPQRVGAGGHFAGGVVAGPARGARRVGLLDDAVLGVVAADGGLHPRLACHRASDGAGELVAVGVVGVSRCRAGAVGLTGAPALRVVGVAGGDAGDVEAVQVAIGAYADLRHAA